MAFGLMLVLEGVLPLVAPQVWRDAFRRMTEMNDGQLRFAGLLSMVIGLLIVLVVK
jgi:uncharacterized protein YjeT (DUF2065 family)